MGNFISEHVLIPKFTIADVSGVTFGGFLADKYPKLTPRAINFGFKRDK